MFSSRQLRTDDDESADLNFCAPPEKAKKKIKKISREFRECINKFEALTEFSRTRANMRILIELLLLFIVNQEVIV